MQQLLPNQNHMELQLLQNRNMIEINFPCMPLYKVDNMHNKLHT